MAVTHYVALPFVWFNQDQYCEFFPPTTLVRQAPNQINEHAA
jgi:hypothetical protein